ncbi:YqzE family protein [Chengkuizengella sediminis]|uniref:YqzE family protein n=1 Tax=Chengkuizengella sediminis TaxID=1885917 RepID=UPI00138949BF|nr:YqzE family protein [Chengkuizengella sediminis]NDI36456.1 YqzE family protein [Chengkuizengella sediminis]
MAKNSGEDLLKEITEKVVRYMNTPKELRNKNQEEQHKEAWKTKWFGMLPIAMDMLFKRTAHKDKGT